MVRLARERLRAFRGRATVAQTDGSMRLDFDDASFDRVVSTYVLDLLGVVAMRRPALTCGCPPIALLDLLPRMAWAVEHRQLVTACALPSEVVVDSRERVRTR